MKKIEKYLVEKRDKLNEGDIFWDIMIDQKKFRKLQKNADDQSKKLLDKIVDYFFNKFSKCRLQGREEYAFNRLKNLLDSSLKDEGTVRNQIFKIANELGMKLPSSIF